MGKKWLNFWRKGGRNVLRVISASASIFGINPI